MVRPSGDAISSCPVIPPSSTVASCLPDSVSMKPTVWSPLLATTRNPAAGAAQIGATAATVKTARVRRIDVWDILEIIYHARRRGKGCAKQSRDRKRALLALPIHLTLPYGRGSDWSTPYARILSIGQHLRKALT